MIAVQLAAKESRLAQELVTTMKVVLSVLGLKTDRVATNHVKSVCLNPYWQIVEFFPQIWDTTQTDLWKFCSGKFAFRRSPKCINYGKKALWKQRPRNRLSRNPGFSGSFTLEANIRVM